jgi:hypothetical protein
MRSTCGGVLIRGDFVKDKLTLYELLWLVFIPIIVIVIAL